MRTTGVAIPNIRPLLEENFSPVRDYRARGRLLQGKELAKAGGESTWSGVAPSHASADDVSTAEVGDRNDHVRGPDTRLNSQPVGAEIARNDPAVA
jgi:hypothetical protein